MKLIDCLEDDWHRYFNGGWMLYKGDVVMVRIPGPGEVVATDKEGNSVDVRAEDLYPYYPEPRAINCYNVAMFVGRRPRQTARRTASLTHYDVVWAQGSWRVDSSIMWELASEWKYPKYTQAMARLKKEATSIAISPDLILWRNSPEQKTIEVIWQGRNTGCIEDGIYRPDDEMCCFTKLARMSLKEVGATCL